MRGDPIRAQVEGLLAMVRGFSDAGVTPPALWEDLARDVVRLHQELTLTLFKERGPIDLADEDAVRAAGLPPGAMACLILAPAIEALRHAPAGATIPPHAVALIAVAEEAGFLAQGRPS